MNTDKNKEKERSQTTSLKKGSLELEKPILSGCSVRRVRTVDLEREVN